METILGADNWLPMLYTRKKGSPLHEALTTTVSVEGDTYATLPSVSKTFSVTQSFEILAKNAVTLSLSHG